MLYLTSNPGRALVALVFAFVGASAFATNFGADITYSDNRTGSGWYSGSSDPRPGVREDNETEPGTAQGQQWDLEATYYQSTTNVLSLAGGYNFQTGQSGWYSGDIFLAVNPTLGSSPIEAPNPTGAGYNYAIDITPTNLWTNLGGGHFQATYTVYSITGLTVGNGLLGADVNNVPQSSPWRYDNASGLGTVVTTGTFDMYSYYNQSSFATALGATGGEYTPVGTGSSGSSDNHYVLTGFNLGFLPTNTSSLYTHYTMGCGNDLLTGYTTFTPVPEPSTLTLLGLAAAIGAGLRKRRRVS